MECIFIINTDAIKLEEAITWEDRSVSREMGQQKPYEISKDICKSLYLRRKTPCDKGRLLPDCLGSSSAENPLEFW